MKLERVEIENYRVIERLELPLDPSLTVLHGANGDGKTSVLSAIAAGLGGIARWLPDVSGVGFRDTDLRDTQPLRVALKATDGTEWDRRKGGPRRTVAQRRLKDTIEAVVAADRSGGEPLDLPIAAFYDTERAVAELPRDLPPTAKEFPRYAALEGALAPKANFREFFKWFYMMENQELRLQKRRGRDYQLPELRGVRTAIERIVPGVSNPRIELRPPCFAVSVAREDGALEELELDQMSGGYRIMLALAADLARRMAQGNPHLDDPLRSEAIVLIDEVDLHLHPAWQQRVLPDLTRTFPNAQFIVSTHSPQVLTTVHPEQIVRLSRDDGRIVADEATGPTYGAEAGAVLSATMGVNQRPSPSDNDFVRDLDAYMDLVYQDRGECEDAARLRNKLMERSPYDYGLMRADSEIRRRRVLKRLGKQP